ncbi:MAG: hypothetical protein M5U26_00620 [Planctomycetota bacterium]|nr:hypothetical protein [Planctomycetota bacterium]
MFSNHMLLTLAALSVLTAPSVFAQGATRATGESGHWRVTLTPAKSETKKDKKSESAESSDAAAYEDKLHFAGGKFNSRVNSKRGFPAADYQGGGRDAKVAVTVEQRSAEHGTAQWALNVDGDSIAGTLTWIDGTAKLVYQVEGTRIP